MEVRKQKPQIAVSFGQDDKEASEVFSSVSDSETSMKDDVAIK